MRSSVYDVALHALYSVRPSVRPSISPPVCLSLIVCFIVTQQQVGLDIKRP